MGTCGERMRILIVTPAPPRSRKGNRISAVRWSRVLRQIGHRVQISQQFTGQNCDALLALHARRSASAVRDFHRHRPDKPLLLVLTGTDLYRDIDHDPTARESLRLASRLILLQPHGIQSLPDAVRHKSRVIYQSVSSPQASVAPLANVFEACVIGHLRPVKDPFRTARAARRLPSKSRMRIVQLGAALSETMERRAKREMSVNPRYQWLGELPRWQTMRRLARSRLLVLTSKMEGGANVVSEAIVHGVPVISSRISGSIGLLGEDYPGYFEFGNTRGLTELLWRAESDPQFLATLRTRCEKIAPLFAPAKEQASWRKLLAEFV